MGEDLIESFWARLRPHLLPALLLVLATFGVYWQTLGHDFLRNWDDNFYILENADVHGLDWDRLTAVFSKYYVGNYAPVQMLSYMCDYFMWGLYAGGYHLTNLLLHTANGLLLYRLLCRLIGDRLAAWSGAALFLLHPVQVETVAWISQRKNLLAMLFFLLAWLFYLEYRNTCSSRKKYHYSASLLSLLLALLSKSVAVIFPVVILVFDHCYNDTNRKPKLHDKVPYLFLSLIAAVLAVHSQTPDPLSARGGGRADYHGGSPMATFLTMLPVCCSYLRMVVWPVNLSAYYDPKLHNSFDFTVLASLVFLGGTCFMVYRLYRFDRRMAFWPLFFFLALLPVSQIIPLVTLMNDRYLYFPLIGVAALLAYTGREAVKRFCARYLQVLVCLTIILGILATLTIRRINVWQNGITLMEDTVRKSPNVPLIWEALGEVYHNSPHPNLIEAEKAYLQVLRLNPKIEPTRYNLGVLYLEKNDLVKADTVLKELLRISPQNVMGLAASGDLALRRFEYAEAERLYQKALALQPEAVQIHQKFGNLMVVVGRFVDARSSYMQVEALQGESDPLNAFELARVEARAGDAGASLRWLEQALQRGYNDYAAIMADIELNAVREDRRFAELISRYFSRNRR